MHYSDQDDAGATLRTVFIVVMVLMVLFSLVTCCCTWMRNADRQTNNPTLVQYHQQAIQTPYTVQQHGDASYLQRVVYNPSEAAHLQAVSQAQFVQQSADYYPPQTTHASGPSHVDYYSAPAGYSAVHHDISSTSVSCSHDASTS